MANGPSLPSKDDLARVKLPFMGMNRSWMRVPNPDYHVSLERVHYDANPQYHERVATNGGLYVVGEASPPNRRWRGEGPAPLPSRGWPCGKILKRGTGTFSKSLEDGIVTELNGIGSVAYAAMQVAYSLGYRELFMLGLDLGGGVHFDGSPASLNVEAQNTLWRWLPDDLIVKVCGSPESRATFEKVPFEEVC